MGLVQEFKEFAVKGNAVDMAIGIIIGAAFGKIVTSVVNDVIMPPIGMLLGGVDFSTFAIWLKEPVKDMEGVVTDPGVAIRYGTFINILIDFIIVAFCLFIVVKMMNCLRRSPAEQKKA